MKKMNNKGFSLVELIIVIAIMAILIAVLAPQYLRYVEKSRLQSDNSAIGEVANAIKVAAANDDINKEIGSSVTVKLDGTYGGAGTLLKEELEAVCGTSLSATSNSYSGGLPDLTAAKNSNGVVEVSTTGYIANVGDTPGNHTF